MIVPQAARADSLRYFVEGDGGIIVHLFVSNTTPADTDEASNYVEASWPGYAPTVLEPQAWSIEASDETTSASYAKLVFKSLGEERSINYGWYATRVEGGRIALAERFGGPFVLEHHGDTISFSVTIKQHDLSLGQWFMNAEGQVGIVNRIEAGKVEFHRVGVEGLTERVEFWDEGLLMRASWADIPEGRRPSLEQAAKLGYR